MPCNCHGKNGEAVSGTVRPDDQCVTCALKHLELAAASWGEFTYERTNRFYAAGQVRLAVEHLKAINRPLALELRDLAVKIEDAADKDPGDVKRTFDGLSSRLIAMSDAERPEIAIRLGAFFDDAASLIIPLGKGSKFDNDELRILLRSVERHVKGLDKVIVVSSDAPTWLHGVEILPIDDVYTDNKDANLIDKTIAAIRTYNLQAFAWCADDNVFLKDVRLDAIPKLINHRIRADFSTDAIWHQRIRKTFDWADSQGIHLDHHFESHAPQYFTDAQTLASRMEQTPYKQAPGLTIMTAFRVVMGDDGRDALMQQRYKETFEKECADQVKATKFETLFCGYNDQGFAQGLRERLFELFPDKSRYEL